MMHLVTGHAGIEHIKPSDDGAFNAGVVGTGKYVFDLGNKFEYEIVSNNLVKIKDGELVNQGRHANIPVNNYEEVTIENGLQGVKRYDLICARYTKNADTSIESVELIVVKGTSSANPSDPACVEGNILEGALVDDFPLYRVRLDGLNIVGVDCLFDTIPSIENMQNDIEALKTANNTKASKDWTPWKETGYIPSNWSTFAITNPLSNYSEINIIPRHYASYPLDSVIIPAFLFRTLTEGNNAAVKIERNNLNIEVRYVDDNTIQARNVGTLQQIMLTIYAR